jgi:lipoprotein-anchoring transpeptidase ErfK/SrfK
MTHATNIARSGVALLVAMAATWSTAALAEPLFSFFAPQAQTVTLQATSEEAAVESEEVTPATLRRQVVDYATHEAAGTVVIDTPHTLLYYVLGNGKAIRYGIGVGREGFTWSGVKSVVRKAEWPDWYPPLKMIGRQPYLPRMTAGGPGQYPAPGTGPFRPLVVPFEIESGPFWCCPNSGNYHLNVVGPRYRVV